MIKNMRASTKKERRLCGALALMLAFFLLPLSVPAAAAKANEPLRVGWYETGAGELPGEADGAHGYDYEYLQALAQYTGWSYEYVHGTWDECLRWLAEGEIDMLGFVQKTPERESVYGFPNLPMGVTNGWLVSSSSGDFLDAVPAELDGIRVGVVEGNAYNKYMESYCEDTGISVSYVVYDTLADISPALKSGEIDAAVVADEDLTPDERCILKLASENQYFVTDIDNAELLRELDEAMTQANAFCPNLASDLYEKYFSISGDGKPMFTAAEQKFIAENPNILVMYDAGWPPVEYYDEELGDYAGISPDLFRLLSEKCGISFVYEGSTSGQVLAELQNESTKNILTTISYDYAWAERHDVYITQPFITSAVVKLGKNVNAEDPVVAINEKAYFTYLLSDELEGVTTKHYAKQAQRLEAVRTGEADYTFVTEDQANYYCSMPKYSDLSIQKLVGREQKICISITKNSDPELLTILSKSLASISHDEMTAIIMKNTVNTYDKTLSDLINEYRYTLIIIAVLAAAAFGSLSALSIYRRRSGEKLKSAYKKERAALLTAEKASAAKGSFMSRMSHEIRTPLNAVIGYNTLARNEMTAAKTEEERRRADMKVMDCLTKSDIASRHLLTIINDVLDMSAIESGKIKIAQERFDFKGLISSLTTIFYSQAKAKGVEFEVQLDTLPEEWFVGDQMRSNQILTNLLSNAVKFTPDGGRVRLSIRQTGTDAETAHIHFEVSDTGIGMTQEYLEHIWTPFEQADSSISRRFGGTGLGLSITKNLVDLMGGSIRVESRPGSGSTFYVELCYRRTEQPQSSEAYDFDAVNALVVDDDASTCDYIQLLFTRCGARCAAVNSGERAIEAFALAKERGEPYTLCLVDWRMPKMDGLETANRLREIAGDNVPIIVITAYDFTEIADKAAEAGVNMFIAKPLFQSSLFDLLANICGRKNIRRHDKQNVYDFKGARLLLAEDNAMNMEIAKELLGSAGFEVDGAWNGKEAVDMFAASDMGYYKAILMDVQMPVMDGHTATKAIRAMNRVDASSIPIIAMTADAFAENVAEALAAGMSDHVSKPIDLDTLFETLTKYI